MRNLFRILGLPNPRDDSESEVPLPAPVQPGELERTSFHDLGEAKWSRWGTQNRRQPHRAVRYVKPDEMYRLPMESIAHRLVAGDVVLVDLSPLVHMEAQRTACRRRLQSLADEMEIPSFTLDSDETLLMLPGADIRVDTTRHELGVGADLLPEHD